MNSSSGGTMASQEIESGLHKDDIRKLVHDFRGPMINVRGFSAELQEGIDTLLELLGKCEDALPAGVVDRVKEIVVEDIDCNLSHLHAAVSQLDARLDEVTSSVG